MTVRGLTPFVELRGRAGHGERIHHDVVVALDLSASSFFPTGSDVDGDGIYGAFVADAWKERLELESPDWTSDFDDTVLSAQLIATRKLITRLDPGTTRLGLISFDRTGSSRIPVGALDIALANTEKSLVLRWARRRRPGTNLAEALNAAGLALRSAPARAGSPRRTVLLVTDGQDACHVVNQQCGPIAVERAANGLAAQGIRVYAFGIGAEARENPAHLKRISSRTSGRYVEVGDPVAVTHELPHIQFAGLESIEILNLASGETGRAVRIFPDGSFDGYAPLVVGDNRVRITARIEGERVVTRELHVHFSKPESTSDEDIADAKRTLGQLRLRTQETELVMKARKRKEEQRRTDLEIRPE